MKKNIYALSVGAFTFGMAEFVMMSILPDAASGLNISIAEAGNLIAYYALGVCAGAPLLIAITRNLKLRTILAILLTLFIVGSLLTAVSNNYALTLVGRFISGLPHGAFFGVAGIVANKLSANGKGTSAVATVMMGMTIANLLGVPIGNVIGHYISWRMLFATNAIWGALTIFLVYKWIPDLPAMPTTSIWEQFYFLKKLSPWLLIIVTVMTNTGIFAWYSYISPFMTDVAKFDVQFMPILMILAGGSMCIGNYFGGKLSDKFTPKDAVIYIQAVLALALIVLFVWGNNQLITVVMLCIAASCFFGMSAPLQQLFLQNAKGGEMMGGALGQLAFNLGNALGAFVGGMTIVRYQRIEYTALAGTVFIILGVFVFLVFKVRRKNYTEESPLNSELSFMH